MSTYSDSEKHLPRYDMWAFYEDFPWQADDPLPVLDETNNETKHIIRAILAGADAIRTTIIEESKNIRDAFKH